MEDRSQESWSWVGSASLMWPRRQGVVTHVDRFRAHAGLLTAGMCAMNTEHTARLCCCTL